MSATKAQHRAWLNHTITHFGRSLAAPPGRRTVVGVALLLSGPLLHFMWNSPLPDGDLAAPLLLAKLILGLVLYLTIVLWLLRYERRWVVAQVEHGRRAGWLAGIDPGVLTSLPTRRSRRALQRAARHSGGRSAAKDVAAVQRDVLDRIQTHSWPQCARSCRSADCPPA